MFRHLYSAYQPGRKANLKLLHDKLKGGWEPTSPVRMYLPKPSGLFRPLTLLAMEDQIVLQAIANQVANEMYVRRKAVENRLVFSHCQNSSPKSRSIFFLQDWRRTYHYFRIRLEKHLVRGNHWIAHFDLAAFYETISHRALQSVVSPGGGSTEAWDLIHKWLRVWTCENKGISVDHGIPQGPEASNFLAEIFLLPLDEAMNKARIPYIRYVDDIRVLGKTKEEAQRAAIILEMECRRWSLIPQSSKFRVSRAANLTEALGSLPSIAESTGRDADEAELDEKSAMHILRLAIGGRPARVRDKSRLRYVLYHGGPSQRVLHAALKLLPAHPEHIDAFAAYFQNFSRSRMIMRRVIDMLIEGVLYDYVQGELWLLASRLGSPEDLRKLLPAAKAQARRRGLGFSMQRALCVFFLSCRKAGLCSNAYALDKAKSSSGYIQSFLLPYLLPQDFCRGGIAGRLAHGASPLPGMVLAEEITRRNLSLADVGIDDASLSEEVRNVFQGLALIDERPRSHFDQIGDILHQSYDLPYC